MGDISAHFSATLAAGANESWGYDYVTKVTDPDPLVNEAEAHYSITGLTNDITDKSKVEVDVVHPNTMVNITPNVWETSPGGNVILNITETNTGDVALENISVVLDPGAIALTKLSPSFVAASDIGNDGILSPNETWTWSYQTTISADTTFVITGYGKVVGLDNIITYPDYPNEQASVEVKVTGATRTLGFWKTHLNFTTYVFTNYTGSSIDLGWKNATSMEKLMGIFWANVAKNSNGSKRSNLCQARVQASWQAIAAILNSNMPGGAPLPSGVTLESIKNTLGGNNVSAIKALASQLDTYNNSGDGVALDPSLPPTGKADPNGARNIADIPFADCT
jgi:hypothetical protein